MALGERGDQKRRGDPLRRRAEGVDSLSHRRDPRADLLSHARSTRPWLIRPSATARKVDEGRHLVRGAGRSSKSQQKKLTMTKFKARL
jgi:hypothetical protein